MRSIDLDIARVARLLVRAASTAADRVEVDPCELASEVYCTESPRRAQARRVLRVLVRLGVLQHEGRREHRQYFVTRRRLTTTPLLEVTP